MNILLTNDDGIHFPGIQALFDEFAPFHDTYIFAPAMEKSATSQAMTLYEDIYVKQLDSRIFIVNGYPVDCVNIALNSGLVDIRFDLVISGINKGVNMGEDIFYSGTVGAGRHALIHDIPAMAVSSGYLNAQGDFTRVARFVKNLVENSQIKVTQPFLWNINYPADAKMPEKIKWTKCGSRIYRDSYKRTQLSPNEFLMNLGGSELGCKETEGSDFSAFNNGYVSITPLNKDGTNHNYKHQEKYQRV